METEVPEPESSSEILFQQQRKWDVDKMTNEVSTPRHMVLCVVAEPCFMVQFDRADNLTYFDVITSCCLTSLSLPELASADKKDILIFKLMNGHFALIPPHY